MARRYRWSSDKKLHSRRQRTRSQLRAVAQTKRDNANPLYDPSQTLTGSRLRTAAGDLVNAEFGPQRRALANESVQTAKQSNALTGKASDYFLQIAQQEQGGVDRAKAIGDMLNKGITDVGTQTQGTLDQIAADAEKQRQADETLRGPGLSGGSTALMDELAAARSRGAANTQTAGQDAAASSADYQRLADLSRQSREQLGGEVVGQLSNRAATQQADVRSRRAALEALVGPETTKQVLGLRQQGFENAATAEGLGIKQSQIAADIQQNQSDASLARAKLRSTNRQNRARNRLTAAQIRATQRGQDISATTQRRGQDINKETQRLNRKSREAISHAQRKGKKLETVDAKKLKGGIANAYAALTGPDDPMDPNGKTYTNRVKFLRAQGAPPIVIQAARERAAGGLKLSTVSELRRLGIRVPRAWIGNYAGPIAP